MYKPFSLIRTRFLGREMKSKYDILDQFRSSANLIGGVSIGDNEAKEMRESADARNRRNLYLKLRYPNDVTLILPADISIEQLRTLAS